MKLIRRKCDFQDHSRWWGIHAWERLNPDTMEPYRRGRVVFLCKRPR